MKIKKNKERKESFYEFDFENFKVSEFLEQKMDNHDFLAYDLLSKMLKLEHKERFTVEQCLKHPYFKDNKHIVKKEILGKKKKSSELLVQKSKSL